MVAEQAIKDYLYKISKGVITLKHQQAREIINIISGTPIDKKAIAKLYRHNPGRNTWEYLYFAYTTNNRIKEVIIKALEDGPIYGVYMWELYNEDGELEGMIYTIKNQLF